MWHFKSGWGVRHLHWSCLSAFALFVFAPIACGPPETSYKVSEHGEVDSSNHTGTSAKAYFYRELLFVDYLQERTGVKTARIWPPDDASAYHWGALLGYGGGQYKVEILTKIYRVFDHDVDRPEVQLAPDNDSVRSESPHVWKILQPAYGVMPMRMFSGLARIAKEKGDAVVVHFEMVYTWENGGWNQVVHSTRELSVKTEATSAELADENGRTTIADASDENGP